ncbi:SDR family oxidoreductase [Cupriavidus basilensis]|uniref:SDR family oxidoreductase n=1 Tax=Cupriavidus basilensis TaxID=68895 RepID=A0ABT6B041_9BURK|nr:SDR family oxidoreductase [Cupriavidus basilensis]MDF3838247.1 SDR family oxidoreductase [Cupriavidus basilensis]
MDQKVALVTNTSGYAGPPAVAALLQAGFRVFVQDDTFTVQDDWNKFVALHPGAELLSAETPELLLEAAWQKAGRVDAIVSNDHYPAIHRSSTDVSLDDLRQTLEMLVVRPFALVRAAIPHFKAQGGGNVVMITSCRTHLPMYGAAIPDAARAGANALLRSFAIELAPLNIAVNAVAPNFLYSEAYYPRAVFIDAPAGREYVKSEVPVGRLGHPEEIGDLIRYLASTQSRFLTGAVVDFSGGWPAAKVRPGS